MKKEKISGKRCQVSGVGFPVAATSRPRIFGIGIAALALLVSPLQANLWNDPEFIDRFTATYGVRGELEPRITQEEQELLRQVAAEMPDNPARAAAILSEGLRADSSAALDFTLGNLRFQLDDFSTAAGHFRDAISKFPDFLRAHKNLGMTLARMEQFTEARQSLGRALTLGSADADTYGLIGYVHLQQEHWASAEASYRQALLFEPEDSNWQLGLGRALQEQERHREANALLSELTRRFPDRPAYWLYQANTFIQLDRPLDAAANIELVRRMNRATPEGLLLLGDIYVNEDLPERAAEAYEAALHTGIALPVTRVARAAERLSQRGYTGAAARLAETIEANWPADAASGDRAGFLRLRARLALATGDDQRAIRFLEDTLEIAPLDGETLILLARTVGPEDLERAEILLEQAARVTGSTAEALRRRGELLVQAGRYQEALDYLRQAHEIEPRETLRHYIQRVERIADGR